ncbi:hypothetical protein PORY_001282 [Pneumocystis oryctolagi]|uniref:Uncharacterized protein n=1 Tax=Pneumocystis oryctolagi TaxID=42067 RepID=A0ACB7CF45_9ASCO|nr:hypothetical protein PORY_001282 [Pneumocystis oryctolagi]
MTGPRFEQTDFSLQPRSDAAIKLIANVPVRLTNKRIVSCDGGGGALGHPKIYINLDKNEENSCGYCIFIY